MMVLEHVVALVTGASRGASQLAVPLMLPQRRGLIVSTTANVAALPYMPNIFYDLAKHTVARMTWAMAEELRPHGIAAVAVAPGFHVALRPG